MSKTFEYSQLGKKEKKVALKDYLQRSLVLEENKDSIRLNNKDIKLIAESHLLYSNYTKYERFDIQGNYLGLFDIHEEAVAVDY